MIPINTVPGCIETNKISSEKCPKVDEVDKYPECPAGANNCKVSDVTDTVNCYSNRNCSCETNANERLSVLGTQSIFFLSRYKPHTRIGCDTDPPN